VKKKLKHHGVYVSRIRWNTRERAFAEIWAKENREDRCINFGHGLLQDLFIESTGFGILDRKLVKRITRGQAKIVATVIQWLGTNCGQCFLWEVEKRIKELAPLQEKLNGFRSCGRTFRCKKCREEFYGHSVSEAALKHDKQCRPRKYKDSQLPSNDDGIY
jgi:hypothetical protein